MLLLSRGKLLVLLFNVGVRRCVMKWIRCKWCSLGNGGDGADGGTGVGAGELPVAGAAVVDICGCSGCVSCC